LRQRHQRLAHDAFVLGLVAAFDLDLAQPRRVLHHHPAALPAPLAEGRQRRARQRKGRLVAPATAGRLWSAKPELQSPEYGYGFGTGKDVLGRSAGHSGGFPGIASMLDIYLDTGWTVVVLSNVDGGMQPVSQKLREVASRIR